MRSKPLIIASLMSLTALVALTGCDREAVYCPADPNGQYQSLTPMEEPSDVEVHGVFQLVNRDEGLGKWDAPPAKLKGKIRYGLRLWSISGESDPTDPAFSVPRVVDVEFVNGLGEVKLDNHSGGKLFLFTCGGLDQTPELILEDGRVIRAQYGFKLLPGAVSGQKVDSSGIPFGGVQSLTLHATFEI